MAIAYSEPVYERRRRRSRRTRRESSALSTNMNPQVAFGDLNLSSQLLYAAMLETWRVVKEVAGEEASMIFVKEEEIEEIEEIEGRSMNEVGADASTGFLAEDILTELENIEYEEMDEVDSNIIEGYEISKFADENNNNDDENIARSLPDLIGGVSVLGVETKLSGSVQDILACCLPTSSLENQ